MATAKEFRARIVEIAHEVIQAEPTNVDARARSFIARLSGSMVFHGEKAAEIALRKVLGMDIPPNGPADGA
jgi:acetolactate synthase small subunit